MFITEWGVSDFRGLKNQLALIINTKIIPSIKKLKAFAGTEQFNGGKSYIHAVSTWKQWSLQGELVGGDSLILIETTKWTALGSEI